MLKSYREKAEVIMMFSIVNLSEQTNSHLNVEGTMSYSGKYFWNIYLTNQNMKDKKGLGISQIFTCGQTEILVTAWSDLYRCTCILSTRVCVTTIDFQTESEPWTNRLWTTTGRQMWQLKRWSWPLNLNEQNLVCIIGHWQYFVYSVCLVIFFIGFFFLWWSILKLYFVLKCVSDSLSNALCRVSYWWFMLFVAWPSCVLVCTSSSQRQGR